MQSTEDALYQFMADNGVDDSTARAAARNCARSVKTYSLAGAGGFAAAGLLTRNPATLLMTAVGGAAGAGLALGRSPSCMEVRHAARNWAIGQSGSAGDGAVGN